MSQSKRLEVSEVDWQRFAARFTPPDYTEAVIAAAINRLENGDVVSTRYGIRVQVRDDLGDYRRSGAKAFWPKEDRYGIPNCACQDMWHSACAVMFSRRACIAVGSRRVQQTVQPRRAAECGGCRVWTMTPSARERQFG